jgi:hypothetical protein
MAANATRRARPKRSAADDRRDLIAISAYYLAERRGFAPGHELEDWLAAEAKVAADESSSS